MSLRGLIRKRGFKSGEFAVTRTAASTDDGSGRRVPGATSTFNIVANVQPYDGSVLKVLPEGLTADRVMHVWTTTLLQDHPQPDTLVIGGKLYAVFAVGDYSGFGATHYVAHVAWQKRPAS
jgi:hypothetical protein